MHKLRLRLTCVQEANLACRVLSSVCNATAWVLFKAEGAAASCFCNCLHSCMMTMSATRVTTGVVLGPAGVAQKKTEIVLTDNVREPFLLSCGLSELYIDDIKARAARTGELHALKACTVCLIVHRCWVYLYCSFCRHKGLDPEVGTSEIWSACLTFAELQPALICHSRVCCSLLECCLHAFTSSSLAVRLHLALC